MSEYYLAVPLVSAALTVVLILLLKPLLIRYALARPNARSSHSKPTPQGGGIAVLATALIFVADVRIVPDIPIWLERAILIIAGLWFINLVNFMDGLDWITVAEMVPITAFIALLGWFKVPDARLWYAGLVAAALCGALLGFAPFNKPVARLFLGDVGSLSIGLLVGWMLLILADTHTDPFNVGTGSLVAAILIPLYYLMDATITLLKRIVRRERVWEAHRSHFYQQATANGFSALSVSAHVFCLNLVLLGLATTVLMRPTPKVQIGSLLLGIGFVSILLWHFSRSRVAAPVEASR